MRMKQLALAAGVLALSAGTASAAVVTNSLNLRSGPSTRYHVIDTMPSGAHVNILNCSGSWCRVAFRGERGWASGHYLTGSRSARYDRGRRSYRGRTYYGGPTVVYGGGYPYYGSGWNSYAYQPGVSFGFGFGGGPYWHHHRGWRRY